MDWKIELVTIPVADVDRAIAFYVDQVGFTLDHDHKLPDVRFTQITPPGSACSILLDGGALSGMKPGQQKGLQVVISDADEAHTQLTAAGVEVGAIEPLPWGRFVRFSDPDGNSWALQESPNRVSPPS